MTFANYWRKSRGYIGECPPDFRQLANVLGVYWRKSSGDSSILVKFKWTFANTSGSIAIRHGFFDRAFVTTKIRTIVTKPLLLHYDSPDTTKMSKKTVSSCNILILAIVDSSNLYTIGRRWITQIWIKTCCVRQIGKSPYHMSVSSILIIENVVKFRLYWRTSIWLSPIDECPGGILANLHMTFAIGENPVGESHIGELPATQSILKQQDRIENLLNSSLIYCIKPNL